LVPHTTSIYGSRFEVAVKTRFLDHGGVFDTQQVVTIPQAKLVRKVGQLTTEQLSQVEQAVRSWLAL